MYSVVCLTPPSAPLLEILYVTSNSVQIQWRSTGDGGSMIMGNDNNHEYFFPLSFFLNMIQKY